MKKWSEYEYLVTLKLYIELTAANETLAAANPKVANTAKLLGRPVAAIAMRLQNFAGIESDGLKGLKNASKGCKAIWSKYHDSIVKINERLEQCSNHESVCTDISETNTSFSAITPEQANSIVLTLAYKLKMPNVESLNKAFSALVSLGMLAQQKTFSLEEVRSMFVAHQTLLSIPHAELVTALDANLPENLANGIKALLNTFAA